MPALCLQQHMARLSNRFFHHSARPPPPASVDMARDMYIWGKEEKPKADNSAKNSFRKRML